MWHLSSHQLTDVLLTKQIVPCEGNLAAFAAYQSCPSPLSALLRPRKQIFLQYQPRVVALILHGRIAPWLLIMTTPKLAASLQRKHSSDYSSSYSSKSRTKQRLKSALGPKVSLAWKKRLRMLGILVSGPSLSKLYGSNLRRIFNSCFNDLFKYTNRWGHKYFCIAVSWCCFIDFSFNVSQTRLRVNSKILRKGMSATPRNGYTEAFMTSTICILEKVVKTSIENSSQVTTIQLWEGGSRDEDAKHSQAFFPR